MSVLDRAGSLGRTKKEVSPQPLVRVLPLRLSARLEGKEGTEGSSGGVQGDEENEILFVRLDLEVGDLILPPWCSRNFSEEASQ